MNPPAYWNVIRLKPDGANVVAGGSAPSSVAYRASPFASVPPHGGQSLGRGVCGGWDLNWGWRTPEIG
jgi:hypothetical protein